MLKKKWHVLFNELKERWPDLTQSDIHYIAANKERLIEIVEQRRHVSANEASRDVDEFLATVNTRQRIA